MMFLSTICFRRESNSMRRHLFHKFREENLREKEGYIILVCLFIISLVQLPLVLKVSPSIVRSDGVGYYAYLRSFFFDHDLNFRNEYSYFASVLPQDSQSLASTFLDMSTKTGYVPNTWPIGPAILWTPFFLTGHTFAKSLSSLGQNVTLDGYSPPYQLAVALGSAIYAFAGLVLVYQICRQYFREHSSLVAILFIWFGTSLTAYMYFMPSMSHACAFLCVSLFFYLWHRTRYARPLKAWFALGVAAGLMALQRLQDSFFVAVIAIELLLLVVAWVRKREWKRILALGIPVLVFMAGAVLTFLPQMLVWRIIYSKFLPNVQKETLGYTFDWAHPRTIQVLFSSHHGLVTWTPIVAFGLVGLYFLSRKDGILAIALMGAFLLQLYVVSSWQIWFQGASFGGRMFISCTIVFVLGLAALLEWLSDSVSIRWLALVGSFFVIWNYLLLFQYGTGMIPREGSISWFQVIRNTTKIPAMIVQMIFHS
jgi:hypothetical protein